MKYYQMIYLFYLAIITIEHISCHSYLTTPISRTNQRQTQTGCRGPQCLGPCDAPSLKAGSLTPLQAIKRGDVIDLKWPRNNHAGGFIRIAWTSTEKSDDHEAFNQNIQLWTCHEMGCKASNFASDPLGGDNDGGSDGKCSSSVRVPTNLSDGNYTMQWAWIGGAFALGDYYSCVDYVVSGGEPVSANPFTPQFQGGDVHFPSEDKCLFYNANDVGICKNEPCTTGNMPGKNSGKPKMFALSMETTPKSVSVSANSPVNLTDATTSATLPPETPTPLIDIFPKKLSESSENTFPGNGTLADLKTVSIKNDNEQLEATYVETFTETKFFGSMILVKNNGQTATSWSVTLDYGDRRRISKVSNAEFKTLTDGIVEVYSIKNIEPKFVETVVIEGTL